MSDVNRQKRCKSNIQCPLVHRSEIYITVYTNLTGSDRVGSRILGRREDRVRNLTGRDASRKLDKWTTLISFLRVVI